MADYGRIQALVVATLPGHVVYERFYSTFTDLERADLRAALQVGTRAMCSSHTRTDQDLRTVAVWHQASESPPRLALTAWKSALVSPSQDGGPAVLSCWSSYPAPSRSRRVPCRRPSLDLMQAERTWIGRQAAYSGSCCVHRQRAIPFCQRHRMAWTTSRATSEAFLAAADLLPPLLMHLFAALP